MPDPNRFERCVEHQVRNCLVCHPIAKAKKVVEIAVEIPEVPEFPNDGKPEDVVIEGQRLEVARAAVADISSQLDSPLVAAAMRYTQACNIHAKAQREVARLKEELDAAKENETNAHLDRIKAQEEMAKLVAAEAA